MRYASCVSYSQHTVPLKSKLQVASFGHRALRESCRTLQESRSARRKPRLARGWYLTFERYCSSYFFSPKFFFKVSIKFCNSFNNFNNSLNSKTTAVLIGCFLIEQSSYTWREELRTNNVKAKTCLFTGQVDVQHMSFTYATYNPDSRDNNLCDKRILPI